MQPEVVILELCNVKQPLLLLLLTLVDPYPAMQGFGQTADVAALARASHASVAQTALATPCPHTRH